MHAGLRGEGGARARICNPLPGGFGHQPSTMSGARGARHARGAPTGASRAALQHGPPDQSPVVTKSESAWHDSDAKARRENESRFPTLPALAEKEHLMWPPAVAGREVRTAERVAAADRQMHAGEVRALELIQLIMMRLPAQ